METRLSLNILITGGFFRALPEADAINYITRIKVPTLMLNGKYDTFFELETNIKPFFNFLGTPEKDKRMVLYETAHYVPKTDVIEGVLGWLDKYFGPVNYQPDK